MLRFTCIGAQKAGTTWLHHQLRQHPQLSLPEKKEIHFWDIHYDRGIRWYKQIFGGRTVISGDITPAYAVLPDDKIAACYRHFPEQRLIYIVREPIDRMWAALRMTIERQRLDYDNTPDDYFIKEFRRRERQMRGNYFQCRENWLRHYAEEQLLILHFDDLAKKPRKFLKRCCEHLDIDPHTLPAQSQLREVIFSGPKVPMRPSLLPVLEEIYGDSWERFQPYITRV